MNLRDYLLILRRRKWIGIIVLAMTLGTAATLTTLATPAYASRASLFVGPQVVAFDEPGGGGAPALSLSLSVAERLTKTYARMIRSVPVAQKAIDDAQLNVSTGYLIAHLTVTPVEDTTLIEIGVVDSDPVRAQNLANGTARAFVELAEELTRPRSTTNLNPQPIVPVTLFESAVAPQVPVSPNAQRNIALAAVLGIVLGAGLMFAAEYLDVAVRGPDDVERLVHLPVLALIPRVSRDDLQPRRSSPPRARVKATS